MTCLRETLTIPECVRERGLDPDDPDWERIGRDWVRPLDAAARERLAERRVAVAK